MNPIEQLKQIRRWEIPKPMEEQPGVENCADGFIFGIGNMISVLDAKQVEELVGKLMMENDCLKDALIYLPKVPTQPYEKELAQKIQSLEAENERLHAERFSWYVAKEIEIFANSEHSWNELKERNQSLEAQLKLAMEGLKQISKQKYGLQGYVEEEDLQGERDYLSKLAFGYEQTASETLAQLEKMNADPANQEKDVK